MKLLVGIVIGVVGIICCGMTYDVLRAGATNNVVDVRIVEVGGHEYVVASSYSPSHSCPDYQSYSYPNKNVVMNTSFSCAPGGSSIAILHHVGCKACCKSMAH